jgi:hypothetical protein
VLAVGTSSALCQFQTLATTGAGLDKFLGRQRVDASAASVSRFKDNHPLAGAGKLTCSHQARGARADDQDMGWMQNRH